MAHIHELIDFTVNAFIVNNNKVLLIHHKKYNMWLPVGGHIELNEDPDEALLREVKEECALQIEIMATKPNVELGTKFLYMPSFMDIHSISDTHKHIAFTYFARSASDAFVHNREEHNDIRWFSREDLDKPEFGISPAVMFFAKEALSVVK